jgi:hypothetical protein
LYDDAVKNKMFWNATPSFQEFQRRLQNPKYVQTVQANYRAHGRSGDAFDTLSGFRDYFCVSDEDKQDMTQGVGNMIADTKARLAGQQRYNKLKQHQDKQRGRYGRLDLGVKNPLTNNNVVRDEATDTYLTSQGAEYAQEYEAARAQNHIDETGKRYTEAVKRGDIPSAFEVRDKDGNYALMEDLGVKPGVHVTEKGKQQQLAGLVNTRKSVEEQYNALYRKLEEDFKRSAPFSLNTHSQYGIDDNDMRLQAYLNGNAQYRRLKAQLHQLDNAIGVGEEAVKGRAEERYVKNAKGMLGYAYRDLKSFGASALRGLWNAVSDVSTWDLGLQDLQDNMTLYTTVKKARQKGYKNLNSEERQMLDVAAKTGAYTAENQQYLGRGYKAGNVTGESLPFMVEMALNPASGLGEAAMSKYMRNAIAKYGKEAVRKEAWKYVTKKCGYRVAGDVLGAALMTGTTGSARTLADTYDRLTGDIKSTYDSNGKIVYDGTENEEKGILKAYLKAFGATAIENHSEFVGEYFNPLLKGAGALTMKGWKKVNAKSANAFLDNLKDMGSTSTAKWLGNLFDKTQWHGTIGEYAEEVVGNIENALLVGDSTLDTKEGTGVFNLDQNIDTFLGVSLMGGFFSTLKTGAYVRDKVKGERKILMQQSLDLDNSIRYALGADPRLADKWKEWRVALAQGTDEEKKQALKEISENTNGNIKKAMYDYSANAQKLAGMDKVTQGAIEDGTITPEQAQRDADIEQAHEEGLAAEGTARHDIQQEHQLRENSLARMLGISAEQLDRMEDEDIESMTGQNDALDTAIYDYQTSRERYQGVIDRATDEVEQAGIDAAHQIDLYTDHSTGQIRPCVIKGNNGKEDYQGYIVNGNIATHPDGAIDVSGSDKMILYFDPETGKIEHGDASTFASLGESADATVARQQAIDEAKQQAAQAQSRDIDGGVGEDGNVSEAMPTFPQSSDQEERNAADFDIGQVVNAETGEVIPVSFEGLAEGENAYLTGGRPDGKTKDRLKVTIVDAEGNVTNRVMKRGNVQVDGRMSAEDFRNAYEEAVSSRMAPEADMNGQENNVDEEGVVAGNAAPSADKAATSEEEGAASEPAVRDKKGNPIYDKMPISATIADLYDGALDDAEIDGFVSAQIAEAEKAVEKMEKKKPKVGTDKAKYLSDKKAWEEGLQEAQRKVQYWQDVKAEVEKITTPEDARGYEEELNGDAAQTAYRNGSDAAAYGAREVTAEFMQSGDVKITPESYRKETGFGAAEQRAMVGKISKGGKSIDKLAEDLEVFDRENYNGMYFGGDSSVAKDAILDYLSSPDSRKGVKKMQSEAEREYVEAYEAERDRYYQEKYHMSYEEYLVYSSQEMPELLRKYSNFDEQLFLERYADEIEAALQKREEQLKQEENGKEGNVSAGEESGHGRSNQVQSGERTDDTGRGEVGKDSAGEVGPRHEGVVESEAASKETITPEQQSLLSRPNSSQYTAERESSDHRVTNNTDTKQENEEKSAKALSNKQSSGQAKMSHKEKTGEKEAMSPTPAMIDRMIEEQRVDDVSELLISSELKKAAEGIAEAFGMKVVYLKKVFIKSDDPAVEDFEGNGFVRNGVIYLSLKEANIAQFTFGHELLHQLKQIDADSYMRIRQKVIAVMGRKAFEMEVKARQMTYANVPGYTLFEDYAEEVIADTLGDIITHTDMLPNIARSLKDNPSLLDRFLKVVDNVRQYFRGKTGGALGDLVNDIRDTYEMTARQGAELGLSEPRGEREQRAANERFNNELTRYQNGEMDKNEMLHLGRAQGVMRVFLPNLPIVMRQRILTKGSVKKHNVAVEALVDMPNHLSHPIFVFKRSDNVLGVLTEMQDRDGKNVCVAIELNRQIQNGGEILEVNDIRSVHGRNVADIVYPIVHNGTLKWVDKEKGLTYLSSASQYVRQEIDKQDLDTATKVVKDFVNPKESDGKDRQFYASLGVSRQLGDGERDGEREQQTANERLKGEGYQYMARDKFSLRLAEAKNNTDKNPSQAQKESGNYRKGHIRFGGYNYTIENPQGSYRSGVDENGKKWKQKMNNTYGYILGTKGKDGDHLDMFINDKADLDSWNGNVYVVDQVFPDGSFDEHKVMYGFDSEEDARKAYLSNYEQGWQGLGNITGVSKEDFDRWLEKSGRKTKAFSEYKNVKSESAESPKTGAFGTVYTQFKGKPQEAIAFLLEKKEGEAVGALHHKDIGDIDLVWGKEGTAKSDGFGLAKLAKYHPEVLGNLQEILDAMVVVKRTDNRVKLESETHQASVRLTWDSEKKNWLLTAFEKKNSVSDNTTDTVGTAEGGKRNDTATPQNTVSDGKDTEKDSSEQEDEEKKASGDRPLYASLGVSRSLGEEAAEGEREATSVRLQKADIVDAEAMAEEYGLDADDVRRYAEGMRKGSSAQAARALAEISRKIIAAHEDEIHSLLDMRKFRKPVEKALKEAFGDVDVLIEERRKQIEEERNTMEAARKRAEEEQRKREARLEELAVLTDEEIDHSYAEALAKGDVAAAREMLDEAARRKGYGDVRSDYQGVGAWSAPSNPDYETDEARRNAVGEDSPDLNVEDMAAGYSNQPEDIFVHPNKYSQGLPTSKESGNAIQTAIDDIRNGKKDVTVKVYRAVPTSVKEGKLRNGDWVTPSRKYAELHGSSRLEGKYRIIEDEVPVSELWWDGNDVNEWGYDNGKGYRYKNVKNNRKLNDLVTRDDNGNVIPPSKRFNQRKADERYQRVVGGVKPSKAEAVLRDAVIDRLRENGMEVITDVAEGQKVLDEANGKGKLQMGDAPETFAERLKQAVENRGVVMPGLNETYVEVVKDIPRHGYTGTIAEATREAIDAAKRKYAGKELTYNNYGVNFNYTISANAIEICLSPKHQNLSANKGIHLALAEHLEEVINNSIEVEEHPDYVKNNGTRGNNGSVNTEALMHRFYGVAVIDGTPFRIMTLMREGKDSATSNGIHSYAVQKIEVLDNDLPSTSNGVGSIPQVKSGSLYPLAKLLKGVEKAYDKGKYLLEESKKRSAGLREQRVYHGSGADGVRFFRTANGEAYGFTVGGRIYVDPRIATSETPVHEYAHLWATALRSGNAEEWQNVVGLMKDSKVWDEVKKRYPELKTDDEIADEVIATYSGQRGAERLREEQRKIAEGNGGVFEKAEAISALEKVKRALKMFWKGVADFLHIHYKSAEEVADRVMKDLLEGVDPRKMGDGVDRQRYASIGVSRSLGEEAGEGEPRYASLGLSEQQLDGDDTIRFSLRQEPAPKVTKKGYAVFIYKKLKNGGYKLVPKMLSNDPGAPAQTWLNADTGYMKRDENGEPLQNTNGRASVSVNGSQAGGNKSNKLAWRPGKHLAMYPNASQFKSPDGTIPKDVIFFEVEYAADPDLHKQYQRNAWELGMNDNGQYRNNQGGLPYIPKDSYYLYRTNSISEGATPMIITGAYKINRALTDAEAKELNQDAGGMWCPRKGGDLTEEKLKDMGLDDKGLKKMTESFDMDTIKESHDESDEARLLPGYKSREINWEDKDLIHSIEENGQDINDYRDGYVAPEHSEEPTIRFSLDKDKGTVASPSKPSKAEAVLRDAVIDRLRENGMEVITDVAEGQKVLDEANGDVREMSFGEPYDYEAYPLGRVEPNLADREVMVVRADADHGFMNYKEAKAWAKQHVSKVYNNEETGGKGDVRISNAAIDKFMSQSAIDKSDGKDVHMSVLKVLPEVLKNSIDVETHPDFLKGADGKRRPENGMNKDVLVHRCYGAVSIDGKPYRVKITLKENVKTRETTHTHSYEATKIELLAGQHGDVTMTSPRNSNSSKQVEEFAGTLVKPKGDNPNTNNSISAAKLLENVVMSYNPGEKVLDASEKRSAGLREQRVYHGSGADGVRFFRTANGEAYGFTVGGRIYVDPRIATSETPVHEYAHLWATALRSGNAEEWQNVVGLMKDSKVWDEVKKRYPELKTDDEIADEVIATYSGQRGAERLREEQRKIAEGNGGVFEKAEAISALEKVKRALKMFWKGVADFLHIHYKSAEEVADRVMKDLLEGVDPRKMGETKDGGVRFNAKQKRALETASLGNAPRSLTVVSSATGAKILNSIDKLVESLEKSATQPKTFIGNVAKALGASRFGSGSEYATFETKNGDIVTIRLANHNAHVSGFDHNGKDNGISIVISPKPNEGITNDGNAHITEFYYDSIKLRRADGKPLAEIVRSIKQALYSGEFKDTTGLAERQEVNGEDVIRYQFIGEKGAAEADHAEEVSVRLDNLSVAREMEAENKDAKAIKMATGWERGADGKWRYEIPDLKEFDRNGNLLYRKHHPDYARYIELQDKDLKNLLEDGEKLTDKEREEYEALSKKYESDKFGGEKLDNIHTLEAYVDAPELFKAYPELRNVRVTFKDTGGWETASYYAISDVIDFNVDDVGEIVVNTGKVTANMRTKELKSVFLHEIQHAIQVIEGFAEGGSPQYMKGLYSDYFLQDYSSSQLHELAELRRIAENKVKRGEYKRMSYAVKNVIKAAKEHGFYPTWAESFDNNPNSVTTVYDTLVKFPSEILDKAVLIDERDLYNRVAGEVEARNVQERMGMSAEERRASLAAETEDVAREDQIFLMGNGVSNQQTLRNVNNQSLFDAIHTLYSKGKTFAEKIYKRKFFDVAETPDFMKRLGLTGDKFTIRYGVISRHFGKDNQHDFTEEEWNKIPKALSNPILITEYYQDEQQKRQKGYRLYTPLKLADGSYVVVSAEVKNAGKNLEINAINTIFGRNAISDIHDRIVYQNPKITPEQMSLLGKNNPHQYPSDQELSDANVDNSSETAKESEGKDRRRYASLGVSRALGEEAAEEAGEKAAEGEPRWASLGLSEQQLDGDDTIRFSLNYDKWDREMASWLKRNRLPKNAQRPVVPQREAGESDLHFAGRLAKYNQDKALWNTAPKYEGHLSSGMTARGEFNYELQRGSVLKRIAIQDSMLAIRKAQEAIARHSGLLKVGTFEDAYMAENNSHGKAKNEFEQYDQEYLEPLRKWFNVMMKRLDGSYNNVTNYMIAKHGLERNAHMAFMAALEAEAKKAIDNTQPDAKRLRAQMVHDAYRQYKADSRRLINDADYEAGKYDYAQWRRTDDAIRKSYCSNYESFRYDKGGVVRDYAGLSSLFLNETDFEEKAAELCADIESKNGHETGELWDAVRQATRQILKNSHDAGMMSDETYDYVRGMYEHYIPLRGWNDSAADEVWDYAGGGRGVFNAALKEAHGRQSLADDPVAYIMNMAESGFLVNNRNWVKQHFLTMAMNHPTDLLTVSKAWYVKTKDQFGNEVWIPASPNIPADETDPAVIEAALNAFQTKMEQMEQSGDATQQRGSLNIEYPQTKSEEREHEVRVMKDGEEYVIYVNGDPQLAQALNNTRAMRVREHEGNFEKACAWLGRKMAAVYTSLSPLFVPSNWARDTTMTLASTAIREDARYNWLLRTKFMRPDVQMRMFGLVKEYQNGKLREKVKSRTATKMEENFWNFMINGGETGFVSTMDVDAFREKIQRDLKDMGRTRLNPVKVGHTIADSVEYINRVIEDSNRFAIYQTSIEYGRGIEEAVQDAKNVTLNFNRKGTGEMGMSAIRQLYLFINPAIQSLQTLGALAKDHKAKFTAVSSAWMASGMLVPLFNELMFNLASAAAGGGGDDDDEFNPKEEYWKFSSFDRRNNCILWIPFTHDFIKIPLAQEFRGFYGIGDMVASAMWGGENAKESWSNYAADLMGQIIDLSPLDPVSYDGNVLVSLMPNAIRPLVEIAQNVTFTGKPIYRESDFNKYDPSFKKAYAGTPDFLLRYSKWMNSIGNKYPEAQQGPVEQTAVGRYVNNPAVIDHLLKSYLGGMYTLGSQIAGAITKASDEETRKDFKTADIPFFSKFVANPNDRPQSKNKGDAYWQDFEKYQRSSHTLGVIRQDARKTGNFSVLEDFYKSEEYKEMKEYEPKAKQRKEEQKYERWKEEGNADLYQPHQQTGEDVYKRHSTPADDFEDTKASILYQKIKPAKDIFDLADINTPSGMDTFNKYYDLAGKVEEAHSVKKEMNAIVKSFVNDEHKATFDPEKMKEYRALRKQYVQLVEDGNRMFEKIKAQRN